MSEDETMMAARVRTYGEPPVYEEVSRPVRVAGYETIKVELAGINPVDIAIGSGKFDAGSPELPYVAGREGIGRNPNGELVWFDVPVFPAGSMAEQTVIPAGHGIELPEGIAAEDAIGLGIAGTAAWLALEWRGQLAKGETVLVLGASGAVGQITVQAARLLGAGRVVAAARSTSGQELVKELGADVVVSTESDNFAADLREATGGGADLVIDCLWGEPVLAAIAALRPHGRLIQVGNSAGKTAPIPAGTLRGSSISILGHRNFWAPLEERARVFGLMCEHRIKGELQLETEVLPLTEVAEAWRRQASSPGHKLALRVD